MYKIGKSDFIYILAVKIRELTKKKVIEIIRIRRMTMEPLVSILTPCYNGEKFISNYVNSIFKQDYSNIEVIFVDDGSNDATKQLILGYENEFLARKYRSNTYGKKIMELRQQLKRE